MSAERAASRPAVAKASAFAGVGPLALWAAACLSVGGACAAEALPGGGTQGQPGPATTTDEAVPPPSAAAPQASRPPLQQPGEVLVGLMEDMRQVLGPGYQLGLATVASPSAAGDWGLRLRPVMSFRWGDFQITSTQGALIENRRPVERVIGLSLGLGASGPWSGSLGLRTDGGRGRPDDPALDDVPEVDPTVRARLQVRYRLSRAWAVAVSLNTDLLAVQGGVTAEADLSWSHAPAPGWRLTAGLGLDAANRSYMDRFYGVPASAERGRPGWRPGPGLQSAQAGAAVAWQFHPRWRAGASLGVNRLLAQAVHSPLTGEPLRLQFALGLVFVSPDR